jgi:hypothetical protein
VAGKCRSFVGSPTRRVRLRFQTFGATFFFRTYEGERLVQEETEPLKMTYYTYPHLRALFLLAGLEVVEQYGSFKKTPLDNAATEMIFLLKKAI